MARYKPYNYDQTMMIPVKLSDQLVPGTIEFAIHHLVDSRIDMSVLDERYANDDNGRPAYDPKVLLKIVLVAYARGILGSRKIERACRENMVFIALTCGQVPDHSTIATFVSSMKEEIGPLFRDILLVCEEMGVDAYIPDVNFRKRDPRFETQRRHKSTPDRFTLEDFTYDEARDIFICPKGRELILRAKRARAGNRFFRRYVIKDGDCTGCEFFSKCLEKKRGGKRRQLHVRIEKKETLHTLMMLKIDTLKGRKTYEKRLGMVEPVYANIRTHKRLDRFTLRGKVKVNIQWKLYWMVHNIEKLVRAGYAYGTN